MIHQLVFLFTQSNAALAGRRLGQQFFTRLGAGALGQLLRQVVSELDELFVLGHRIALALELDDCAHGLVGAEIEPEPAELSFAVSPATHD